ncbi:hypothetical protein D3C81_950590 [compost metagenome]
MVGIGHRHMNAIKAGDRIGDAHVIGCHPDLGRTRSKRTPRHMQHHRLTCQQGQRLARQARGRVAGRNGHDEFRNHTHLNSFSDDGTAAQPKPAVAASCARQLTQPVKQRNPEGGRQLGLQRHGVMPAIGEAATFHRILLGHQYRQLTAE